MRGLLAGTAVPPDEATLTLYAAPTAGRRVVVVDATTRLPLAGVAVRGCDAPPASGPCPAPVDALTDASGQVDFAFAGPAATFSAASPAVRADGRPRYDRVSVVETGAATVLIPLTENPVHAAAGFTGSLSFRDVHSSGALWLGLATLSSGDLLGHGSAGAARQHLQRRHSADGPAPGRARRRGGLPLRGRFPLALKGTAYGLGEPGRRASVGFAGQLIPPGSTCWAPRICSRTRAPWTTRSTPSPPCQSCRSSRTPRISTATASARIPGCAPPAPRTFPPTPASRSRASPLAASSSAAPRWCCRSFPPDWTRRWWPRWRGSGEAGLLPLGFSSRAGGAPNPDGTRPVAPVVLRSGAPYGGVEAGLPGIWATAAALGAGAGNPGNLSARVTRGGTLPARVVLPPFLPVPEGSSYSASSRAFSPGQPRWNALGSAGATVGRVVLSGTDSRHVVWFALSGGQASLRVPEPPAGAGLDAASQAAALEVTGFQLSGGVTLDGLVDLPGANLTRLSEWLQGYSRFRAQ